MNSFDGRGSLSPALLLQMFCWLDLNIYMCEAGSLDECVGGSFLSTLFKRYLYHSTVGLKKESFDL